MLDRDEKRWLRSTANELNNLLQVINESSRLLIGSCEENSDTRKYFKMLLNGVERAAQVTKLMIERAESPDDKSPLARREHLPTADDVGEPLPLPDRKEIETAHEALPRPSHSAPPLATLSNVRIYNAAGARELIMIVDDEDLVTLLAQRVLADEGYRVITARNGAECLDIYRKLNHDVDLIILDFTMPNMDGSEVFEELRMLNPSVSVVLSSGFAEDDRLREMLEQGLRGFIPKPYTQQTLLQQVRLTLEALSNERTT